MTSEERAAFVRAQVAKAQNAVWNGYDCADEERETVTRDIVDQWEKDMPEVAK